jgi:hypothetical protein
MPRFDRFHCQYYVEGDETLHEIEGGFSVPIDGEKWEALKAMSVQEYQDWTYEQAKSWGLPDTATISKFWFAG